MIDFIAGISVFVHKNLISTTLSKCFFFRGGGRGVEEGFQLQLC